MSDCVNHAAKQRVSLLLTALGSAAGDPRGVRIGVGRDGGRRSWSRGKTSVAARSGFTHRRGHANAPRKEPHSPHAPPHRPMPTGAIPNLPRPRTAVTPPPTPTRRHRLGGGNPDAEPSEN